MKKNANKKLSQAEKNMSRKKKNKKPLIKRLIIRQIEIKL